MPRRILSDSNKGWSGWESRFNAALRMSKSSMLSTRVKNEQEGNRLSMKLRHIRKNKQRTENLSNKDIKETKDDFIKIIASGQVYRKHRFEKYDPYLKEIKERRTVVVDKFKDIKKATKSVRLANIIAKGRLLERPFNDLTPIPEESGAIPSQTRRESVFHPLDLSSSVGLRSSNSTQLTDHRDRLLSASSRVTDLASVRSEQLRVKEYSYKRIKRKAKTIIMSRDRTIFPGECKSTYEMRKFMAQEATDFIYSFSPEGRRKAQIDHLKREVQLPSFVDRTKSTSAIMRHFREYKSNRTLLEPI
ncbi:uncharacterized protein LOC110464931 [Mizuhopecten yessoensis]|uniref:Uncharacterized protein n=1 Tax=Mizuhopecten yessoensis TaxID=6573 RepID=A0A210PST4_MIZYE|nr:uncharacterized protein LOC110464931 [Mizuhopecten yessoensis]OWF39522.1 hypothetical protein KP79_PYT11111 [Mizuhopecten yessoensis]